MYVKASTWIESGPQRRSSVAVRLAPGARRRHRGVGSCTSNPTFTDWFNPANNCKTSDLIAATYSGLQYGTFPTLPPPPVANVPTPQALSSPDPNAAVAGTSNTGAQWEAWRQASQDAIVQAEAAGTYTPSGLPGVPTATDLSDFWNQYGNLILLGGVGLVTVLLLAPGRRS